MIATDALAHVAHNSTAENRRQGLDLHDIEHLFVPLVLNGSLGEILAYLARASAGGFTSNRTLDVTSRAYGLQAELAASGLTEQFLATRAPDLFAIGVVHGLSLTEPRFRPTSPLPTQPPTMSNGARSRLWLLRRKQPTEILKGQPTPRSTIVTAWAVSYTHLRAHETDS